jgi:GMP synthase (glutamine-hydrolysing)
MYVDWPELSRLPAADGDPVFGELPAELAVLEWHEDMIELPPGASELATTRAPGIALYRVGDRAWGSQAHLEVTPSMLVDTWLAGPSDVAEIEAAGHDIHRFRAQSLSALGAQMPAAAVVFSRFATVSRQRAARSSAAARSGSRRR